MLGITSSKRSAGIEPELLGVEEVAQSIGGTARFCLDAALRERPRATAAYRPKRQSHPGSGLRAVASLTATGSSKPSPRR